MNSSCLIALLAIPIISVAPCHAEAPLPPDLAAVPANALGFVHIRLADAWKSDALSDLRETAMMAGNQALAAFDKRFFPAPSSIDRLTVVAFARDADFQQLPTFCAILSFSKPFDRAEVLKSLPDAKEKKTANGSYWLADKLEIAVSFVDDRLIIVGPALGVAKFQEKRPPAPGPLTDALHAANSKSHISLGMDVKQLPPKAVELAAPGLRPLLQAETAVLRLGLDELSHFDVRLAFADEKAAATAVTALEDLAKQNLEVIKKRRQTLLETIRGNGKIAALENVPNIALALIELGNLEELEAFSTKLPLTRDRNLVKLSGDLPGLASDTALASVAMGMLLPAVQQVRVAAGRISSTNNLKQIGLAMRNYHDTNGTLPPAAICDTNGKPLLSWRVAILPFIEQQELYKKFHLDESWDSEHNKTLIPLMPKTYSDPMYAPPVGITNYRVIYGKDCAIGLQKSLTLVAIGQADGVSNTAMVFQMEDLTPWTRPDDLEYDKSKPLPKFFPYKAGFLALFADGSVRVIPKTTPEKTVRQIIEYNDGGKPPIP